MKTHVARMGTAMLLVLAGLPQSIPAQQAQSKSRERIGIYDSRAVAMAYVGAAFQERKMKDLMSQLQQAEAAGNSKAVSLLKAEGQAWQAQLHKQGFGTAPVDDLLVHIAGDLPEIQKEAGVTKLVSKWNKAELEKHPQADQIDLTMKLVDAFHPNETQRKRALEIQKIRPEKTTR